MGFYLLRNGMEVVRSTTLYNLTLIRRSFEASGGDSLYSQLGFGIYCVELSAALACHAEEQLEVEDDIIQSVLHPASGGACIDASGQGAYRDAEPPDLG